MLNIFGRLSIMDKFRLECVSHYWKENIFDAQTSLVFDSYYAWNPPDATLNKYLDHLTSRGVYSVGRLDVLRVVVQKCTKVSKVTFKIEIDEEAMQIIGDGWPQLQEIR